MNDRVTEDNYFLLDDDVRELAERVSFRISEKKDDSDTFSLDPLTIINIANAVIGVIEFIYMCYSNNPKDVLWKMRDPGFFQRIMMKRELRRHIDRKDVDDAFLSLVEESYHMTKDDVASVLKTYESNQMFKKGE